jgi:hypothetical protein
MAEIDFPSLNWRALFMREGRPTIFGHIYFHVFVGVLISIRSWLFLLFLRDARSPSRGRGYFHGHSLSSGGGRFSNDWGWLFLIFFYDDGFRLWRRLRLRLFLWCWSILPSSCTTKVANIACTDSSTLSISLLTVLRLLLRIQSRRN